MLPSESFGQKIRQRRQEMSMTQQQLADMMFVSRRTIINWESGNSLPDISMLSRLADHLDLGTLELIDEMAPPENRPIVIAVESNEIILKGFTQLMVDTLPDADVYGFDRMSEALHFCTGHKVSVAFINVELQGESGMMLAKILRSEAPKTNVVFMAKNLDSTADAWKLHASGYVLLPLTASKIREEIENLRYPYRSGN